MIVWKADGFDIPICSEGEEEGDNSDQSWLDWLGEKSEKFVFVTENAAENHADDDNE